MKLKRMLGKGKKNYLALGDEMDLSKIEDGKSHPSGHGEDSDFSEVMRHTLGWGHGDGDENWLISYADMMTLLFGFFVMMMSFSKIDVDTYEKARKETTQYFGGEYHKPFQNLQNQIKDEVKQQLLAENMHYEVDAKGLTVTFGGALFFDAASIELKKEANSVLNSLVPIIQKQGPATIIVVEGHTDDNPIKDTRFPSNWELSSFRASTVLRVFEKAGFNRSNLRAIGFGDTMPAYPNRDKSGRAIPENQAQNRRVVLRILNNSKK